MIQITVLLLALLACGGECMYGVRPAYLNPGVNWVDLAAWNEQYAADVLSKLQQLCTGQSTSSGVVTMQQICGQCPQTTVAPPTAAPETSVESVEDSSADQYDQAAVTTVAPPDYYYEATTTAAQQRRAGAKRDPLPGQRSNQAQAAARAEQAKKSASAATRGGERAAQANANANANPAARASEARRSFGFAEDDA